ncbi:unnamed protein product [Prunus armeniaca]
MLAGQEECYAKLPSKRKTDARNVSPLKKKPRLPSAEKTQVGAVLSSFARVKHLVGVYSNKIGSMRHIRDVPLKPLADEFGDSDMLREVVHARSSSLVERQRDTDIPLQSLGCLHQSKSEGRFGRFAHPSNNHDPAVESRAIKRGVDSSSPIPLKVSLAEARKVRESSAHGKGSSATSAADPNQDKSNPVGDANVSDLLKTHFLSSLSACAELVDQIRQAGNLVFVAETIWNLSAVTPSSAQLNDLEKKDVELISKLSAEETCYEKKTSDLRTMIPELKSSLAKKDFELSSSAADLAKSKFEAIMDAYKLGYLDCTNGDDPFYSIRDKDIEMLCPDMLPMQKEDVANEVVADIADQAGGAAKSMANQADAKKVVDQGSPAGASK